MRQSFFCLLKGVRQDYAMLVGGTPLNEAFANSIGADSYRRDAAVAVETAGQIKCWKLALSASDVSCRLSKRQMCLCAPDSVVLNFHSRCEMTVRSMFVRSLVASICLGASSTAYSDPPAPLRQNRSFLEEALRQSRLDATRQYSGASAISFVVTTSIDEGKFRGLDLIAPSLMSLAKEHMQARFDELALNRIRVVDAQEASAHGGECNLIAVSLTAVGADLDKESQQSSQLTGAIQLIVLHQAPVNSDGSNPCADGPITSTLVLNRLAMFRPQEIDAAAYLQAAEPSVRSMLDQLVFNIAVEDSDAMKRIYEWFKGEN